MNGTVFVVDDDERGRELIRPLLDAFQFCYEEFETAENFLTAYDEGAAGCVLAEIQLPGSSGLDLLQQLTEMRATLPVVLMSSCAKTPVTVRALRLGALNVLDKPIDEGRLWEAIREAMQLDQGRRADRQMMQQLQERFRDLTAQENDVLQMLLAGMTNRQIAGHLQVSTRTVESRRQNIFRKTRARTVPDLVRLAVAFHQNQPPMPPFT